VDTMTTSTFAAFNAARGVPACPTSRRLMVDGYLRLDGTGLRSTQISGAAKQVVIGSTEQLGAGSNNCMVRPHVSTDPHAPPRGRPS